MLALQILDILTPVRTEAKTKLFLKNEVLKRKK